MSDYNDSGAYRDTPHNSFYPESLQGRPQSGYPPSTAGRRAPRYSRPSNPSWVSNGILSPPPFAGPPSTTGSRPLPAPSPPPSRGTVMSGMSEFRPQYPPPSELGDEPPRSYRSGPAEAEPEEWDPETERMTIGAASAEDAYEYGGYPNGPAQMAPDYESQGHGYEQQPQGQGHQQYDQRQQGYQYDQRGPEPHAQQVHDSFYDPIAVDEPAPKKKSTFVGGFVAQLRKIPKAMVKSHLNDRKSTRKGAPGTEQAAGQSHYLPAYDDPGVTVTDPASVLHVEGVGMPMSPRSTSQVSYANPSRPQSGVRSAHRHSSQSNPHSHSAVRPTSPPRILTTPPMSPVLVSPHPASDYAKMDSPVRFAAPDDSFSAHVTRVKDFVHELAALPWTSSRVALDYLPAASPRARVGKAKQAGSWYSAVQHQDIDLLGSARPAPRRLRSEDGIAIAHDGRTPASFVTSPGLMPSPGMSSHGQGQQGVSYSYYFSPPQPLYVYQSPMTAPAPGRPLTDSPGSSSSSSRRREVAQAVPVYMMAGPPPGLIPSPPPAAHLPGSPNPPPPGLPASQVPSHHSHPPSQ